MLRSLRKAAVSLGLKKDEEGDAAAKHKMKELHDGLENVKKALVTYSKSSGEHGTTVAHLHDSLAALYPPGQAFSAHLEALVGRHSVWSEAKEAADAAKSELEGVLVTLAAKHKELSAMVESRASLRQDQGYYAEKIASLEGKPKEAARLEENKAKLVETNAKFSEVDAALVPLLDSLDKDIADRATEGLRKYIGALAAAAKASADAYEAALAGVPAPLEAGGAAGGGAAAGGSE